jgi:hypothetical protein
MAYRDDFPLGRSEAAAWLGPAPRRSIAGSVVDFQVSQPGAFPEIDCIRRLFPWQTIARAERRADEIGVGADRVLIATGFISEERYLAALARWLGVGYLPLEDVPRAPARSPTSA